MTNSTSRDLTGMVFSRWYVIGFAHFKRGEAYWDCRCSCPNATLRCIANGNLTTGKTKSCGCLKRELASVAMRNRNLIHGKSRTMAYRSHRLMMQRCYNKKSKDYARYGAIGRVVCAGWHDPVNFCADMGEPPPRMQIDRFPDNNGGYWCGHCQECLANGWPANCRWATSKENNRNRSDNRLVTINEITMTVAEASEISGTHRNTIYNRLSRGWTDHEAVFGRNKSHAT